MEKETFEEAAGKLYPLTGEIGIDHRNYLRKEGFIEGAKWRAEQDKNKYSEALEFGRWIIQNPDFQNDSSWSLETAKFNFEQFKKK